MRQRAVRPVVFVEGLMPLAKLSAQTAAQAVSAPTTATAGFKLLSSGIAQKTNGSGVYGNIAGEWLVRGSASGFECFATQLDGDTPSGTFGTWLALTSTRTWELVATSQTFACNIHIAIRSISRPTDIWSAVISLNAESA